MSDDADKICRAMLYHAMKAATLEEAREAIKVIAGSKNIAEVDGILAQEAERNKSAK